MAAAQPRAGHSQHHWHAAVAGKGLACCWQALNGHGDRRGQANRFKRGHGECFPVTNVVKHMGHFLAHTLAGRQPGAVPTGHSHRTELC